MPIASLHQHIQVADPGFPVGGVDLVRGVDSWGSYVSKILYVCQTRPSRSTNAFYDITTMLQRMCSEIEYNTIKALHKGNASSSLRVIA